MPKVELFGAERCLHTRDMREWLEDRDVDFVEYDVDLDAAARQRVLSLTGGQRLVPVLVEDDAVVQVGWLGHGCIIDGAS
jgi:glutaredoxin 3